MTLRECMDCGEPASHTTADGVPLCDGDYRDLKAAWADMDNPICTCGHYEHEHKQALFGLICEGRDWQETGACGCSKFKARESAS